MKSSAKEKKNQIFNLQMSQNDDDDKEKSFHANLHARDSFINYGRMNE
jgi:hypothetical protein